MSLPLIVGLSAINSAMKATTKNNSAKKNVETTKKIVEPKYKISYQFADKEYNQDILVKIAKDIWKYDYKKNVSELTNIKLFLKPEESKVYYVFNDEIKGAFDI